MKKGETATEIFFVRSGIVETTEKDPTLGGDDDYKVSAIVEKGDCFGDEVVFAHDDTRMKFARCRTDVELLVLKKADLLEILGEGEDSRKMEKTVQKQSALLSSFPRSCYRGPPKLRVRAPRQSRAGTTALRLRQRSAVAALSTRTTTTSWTSMNGAEIHHLRSHTAPFDSMHSPTRSPSPTDSSCWLHVVAICYLYCSRLDELRERFKEELVLRGPTAAPFDKHGEELYRRCALPLQSALVDAETRCRRSCLCGPSLLTERACMLPPPPCRVMEAIEVPGAPAEKKAGGEEPSAQASQP